MRRRRTVLAGRGPAPAPGLAARVVSPGRASREGRGTPDTKSADLLSYLLFDAEYTHSLLDIGYRDAA